MGDKLKREVACLQCLTVQHADNEFCEKCRINLFETVGCDQCTYGPVDESNPKKCTLENVAGRCMKFDQTDLKVIKVRAQEQRDKLFPND